jgi:hypothetical protein
MSAVHVQPPHAVAYLVPSSRHNASYQKDSGALQQLLKTLVYLVLEPRANRFKREIPINYSLEYGSQPELVRLRPTN